MALSADLRDIAGHDTGQGDRPLPSLIAELDTTLSRQARISLPAGRSGGDTPLPFHERAGHDLAHLADTIAYWVAQTATVRRLTPPARPGAEPGAAWLLKHLHDVAQLEQAAQALTDITGSAGRARDTINRPPDRRYVGPCDGHRAHDSDMAGCGADLYVPALGPGRSVDTVRCRERVDRDGHLEPCGATYPMEARRAWLLEAAVDRLLTAAEMSRAVEGFIEGRPISPNTISQWASRGQRSTDPERPGRVFLTKYGPHPRDTWKRSRFRVGEVIEFADRAYRATQHKESA